MSRWLSSVNDILNQLDGQVENVATNASTVPEVSSAATVDAILNKRGLSNVVEDDEIEEQNENQVVEEDAEEDIIVESQEQTEDDNEEEEVVFEETIEFNDEGKAFDVKEETEENESENKSVTEDTPTPAVEKSDASVESTTKNDGINQVEKLDEEIIPTENTEKAAPVSSKNKETTAPSSSSSTKSKSKEVITTTTNTKNEKEISNNKKEIRKLHHTIIELNKDLEITETEMTALRDELERTGIRIEKDRVRYKEEKTTLQKHHFDELSQLKVQHAEAISNLTKQHNTQIETLMSQIQSLEEGRIKESGGYQQELSSALQREQDFTRKNFLLEEEKMTLQSHISMLESQNKTLEGRVEYVTQTANTAMDREKEMEEKMDDMLSLHAKLINQRQVREAELERTIADLGAALVVAKKSSEKGLHKPPSKSENNEQALQEEIETLKAQFMIESQHCTTLKQEMQDISNERTEEVAQSISKQRQSDRKITDLNNTITKLQSQISDLKGKMKQYKNVEESHTTSSHEQKKLTVQIQSLSDQILRQQMRLDLNSSEVSTLKSRLQVALARADNAEHKLNTQLMEGGISDVEKGYAPSSGSTSHHRGGVRRRKKGESIRSAFKLQNGDKQVGKAIDVMDKFAMEAGKFLRYNAMARGIFILYLLVLHLWVLFILVFHVHSFEKEHGDFGSLHDPRSSLFKNVTRKGN